MESLALASDSPAPAAAEADAHVLLIEGAIALVLSGVSPRVVVVGISRDDQVFGRARMLAERAGVHLVELACSDRGRTDLAVEGGAARRLPARPSDGVRTAVRQPPAWLASRLGFRPNGA